MVPPRSELARSRRTIVAATLALALGGFSIGTTEFMTMGLLPDVADTIGHSVASTGNMITAYAFGVVVGTPIIAGLVAHLPRREIAIVMVLCLAAGNALTAMMSSYPTMLLARFIAGLPHGAYFGVASLLAASLVEPERRGRAVSRVMLGLSFAQVLGVPLSTWLGQQLGWRVAYWLVAGLFVLSAIVIALVVRHTPGDHNASMRSELAALRRPAVIVATLAGTIGFGGMFAMNSYVAPLVTDVADWPKSSIPWFLLAFGVGGFAGTWAAGHLGDRDDRKSIIWGFGSSAIALAATYLFAGSPVLLLALCFVVAATSSIVAINLTLRLMHAAGSAQMLGAGLNHSSLNMANGLGALIGSLAIQAGWGNRMPSLLGAGLAVLGVLIFVGGSRWSERHA